MKTFSNIPINGYIYCLEIRYTYLYIKVFQIHSKQIYCKRSNGKFGGRKCTQITFYCRCVNYQCQNYIASDTYLSQIVVDGASDVDEYCKNSYYRLYIADKSEFDNILKFYKQNYNKNITLINQILQNKKKYKLIDYESKRLN